MSGNSRSYESIAPENSFPTDLHFRLGGPHLILTDVSHIYNPQIHKADPKLEILVYLLQSKGVRFDCVADQINRKTLKSHHRS